MKFYVSMGTTVNGKKFDKGMVIDTEKQTKEEIMHMLRKLLEASCNSHSVPLK